MSFRLEIKPQYVMMVNTTTGSIDLLSCMVEYRMMERSTAMIGISPAVRSNSPRSL